MKLLLINSLKRAQIAHAIVLLGLLAPGIVFGRARAFSYCEQGNQVITTAGISSSSSTPVMRSYPSCTITVYNTGTLTLSTLYSDNSSTPLANPFTANSFGYWFFYAANGRYDVKLSGGGLPAALTLFDVILTDPANFTAGVTSWNSRTGAVTPQSADYSFSMISGNITIHAHSGATQGGLLDTTAFAAGTKSGTGLKLGTSTGTLTAGKCLEADVNGNIVTAVSAAACGTGTSPVTSVFGRTGAVVAVTNDYAFTQISGTNAVNKGGTGATTLSGFTFGNGTSAFTAYAAGNVLQYLRSKPNAAPIDYEFVSPVIYYSSDYDFPAQTPGGSLAIGVNTIALAPCPLGVAGADSRHPLYVSAGTGTAEYVVISGGTCTSGASSGNVSFTAANTHTGAWTVQSGTGGVREAILASGGNALVQVTGSTLSIGGPDGIAIDVPGITLQGTGTRTTLQARANANSDSVISINAGGSGARLLNLAIDGNRGNTGTNVTTGRCVLVTGNALRVRIASNYEFGCIVGNHISNGGGVAESILIDSNQINLSSGSSQVGVFVDTAAVRVIVTGNDFSDTDTPVTDNSLSGATVASNFPMSGNLISATTVAASTTVTLRCGQSITLTGATAVSTISVPTAATAGCRVTLIPSLASTWVTDNLGNLGQFSLVQPGVALSLTYDGTLWWPSY